MELTQARVRELFDYQDGKLIWKVRTSNRVRIGDEAGYKSPAGYMQVSVDKKLQFVHRIIFLWHHGFLPEFIDHIDCDRTNNRIINLRQATKVQNGQNRGAPAHNKSGYKGVSRHKNASWRARIKVGGKEIGLGYFSTIEDAAKAYEKAANEMHGEFARAG